MLSPTVGRQFDLNKEVRRLDDLLLVSYVTLGKLLHLFLPQFPSCSELLLLCQVLPFLCLSPLFFHMLVPLPQIPCLLCRAPLL